MASSASFSAVTTNKIVVKGIPSNVTSDKLTIYFQKKKNVGGGDVQSVTFPLSNKERDTAIIAFEEAETVKSVLGFKHKIGGSTVTVEQYQPQPRIYENITAKISDYVIQHFKSKNLDVEDVLENIIDCTGCNINPIGTGQGYKAEGEWYQMQAALERIESLISDGFESGNPGRVSEKEYMARNVLSAPTPTPRIPVSAPTSSAKPVQPSITQEVISSVIDKDMYAYMKMVHSTDLDDIKKKFDVAFDETVVGDASKISFSPTNLEGNPQRAAKALDELHNRVSNSVVQDVVKINTKLSDETLKRIFASLCPEFPKVHMARVHNSPDNVIFTAPDQQKCTMATDMFKHFLQREIDMSTQSSPGSNANNADTNMISVDKDIYGYLELVQSDTLNKIWSTNGVRIDTETIDDCLEIRLRPTVPGRQFNPDLAIDQFQKLYNRIQDEATQKNFDMGGRSISTNGIAQVLRMVRTAYKDVYVAEMHGAGNNVLFIADKKERCDQAITTFGRLLNPYAK